MILRGRHVRYFSRSLGVVFVVLTFAVVATAYTLVLRDGRRMEIPAEFTVSKTTLTYEISPGFQKTILLDTIDVPATERANNESRGSLLKRATSKAAPVPTSIQKSSQTITNRNLETFRQTRLESEAEYERRRKELGLPSLEESRRKAELEAERVRERLLAMRSQEAEQESYWRSRASELRAEIAATNARIDFVRARLNETSNAFGFGVFNTAFPFGFVPQFGFSRFGNRFGNRFGQRLFDRQPVFSPRRMSPQIRGRTHFGGGQTRGRVFINPHHRRGFSPGFPGFGQFPLLITPFQDYDLSYERSELIVQLDELLAHHAGLQARWRDLEEEARRAGAYPGWLRP